MIPAYYLLLSFAMAWFMVLSAVLVGAYAVFRTKRESHEPFMQVNTPPGDVIPDPMEGIEDGLAGLREAMAGVPGPRPVDLEAEQRLQGAQREMDEMFARRRHGMGAE